MARTIDIKALIAKMTRVEKVSLLSGLDFWSTKSIVQVFKLISSHTEVRTK